MSVKHSALTGLSLHQPFYTGLDAAKPAAPVVGDHYYATDTNKVYQCQVGGAWVQILPVAASADEKVKNVTGDASAGYLAEKLAALYPSLYQRDQVWSLKTPYATAANRYIILTPNKLSVDINGTVYFLTAQADVDLSLEATWDTVAGTDYRTVANRAGKDFYIYACVPVSGSAPTIKVSANSTTPSGYLSTTSRKIGGFHGLCHAVDHATALSAWTVDTVTAVGYTCRKVVADGYMYRCISVAGDAKTHAATEPNWASIAVGATIVDDQVTWLKEQHALEGFAIGDILPASIWDLNHRPISNPEGMVYSAGINKWVDIYLASGTGASTASVNGATITDTRNWMDFTDDGGAVKKRMLADEEFQIIATGSNEETNIHGGADPGTAGGHEDTSHRRMISNIGVEDACGALYQWLSTQSYFYTGTTGYYGNLKGNKGSYYTNYAADPGAGEIAVAGSDVKLLAGGRWDFAAFAGSRCRNADSYRWNANSSIGCRFCAEPV